MLGRADPAKAELCEWAELNCRLRAPTMNSMFELGKLANRTRVGALHGE